MMLSEKLLLPLHKLAKTFSEKILAKASGKADVKVGEIITVEPDIILSHDNSAAISKTFKAMGAAKIKYPNRVVFILDHCVPAADEKYATNHKVIREFVKEQHVQSFYDVGQGICHQVLPEKGHVVPGSLVLGSDSHTTTHGAFGAFAAGVGTTDLEVGILKGVCSFRLPETMKITLNGTLPEGVYAKDVILYIIKKLTVNGATDRIMEFHGVGLDSIEESGQGVLERLVRRIIGPQGNSARPMGQGGRKNRTEVNQKTLSDRNASRRLGLPSICTRLS